MANNENGNGKVKIFNVRLAFANVFKARSFKDDPNQEPKYTCSFLIPKDTPEGKATIQAVKDAMKGVYDAQWPKNGPKLKPNQVCLRDGDLETYEGFPGHMFVATSSITAPKVVDRDLSKLTEADDKVYSGCIVNAVLRLWAQDNNYGSRINCTVEAIQFVAPGQRVGGAQPVDPMQEFEALDGDTGSGFSNIEADVPF
jgi:hypothetical protein